MIEEWTVNFAIKNTHSESISICVTEKFGFKVHVLKYLKHLMRFCFFFFFFWNVVLENVTHTKNQEVNIYI
jgi:hypothetical protein